MKTFSLDQAADMCLELFDNYVETYAYSMMSGELPAITYLVHRTESKDHDWTASIRLKNSLTISIFRCEIYIADILLLCRRCKMYLQTPEVFRITSLFYMLHALLQTQHMDFSTNTDKDFDSMMTGAGYSTYQFIKANYTFTDPIERIVLDILWYHSMIFTNNYKHAPRNQRVGDLIEDLQQQYASYMKQHHTNAFRMAKRYKSMTNQVSEDGFIVLEPKSTGRTEYVDKNGEVYA